MKVLLVLISLYLLAIVGLLYVPSRTLYPVSRPVVGKADQFTATRHYSEDEEKPEEREYQECKQNCPWEASLDNDYFKASVAFRSPFDIDDDATVTEMKKQLACVPFTFGYTKEKGEEVFPPKAYPSCASKAKAPVPILHLNPDNGQFSMECSERRNGKFVLKPGSVPHTEFDLYTDLLGKWTESEYRNETVLEVDSEYVLGACGESGYGNAQLIPKFNKQAWDRAKQAIAAKGNFTRPIVILFLALDSFSRRHFYRKMPLTVSFLNQLNSQSNFTVFDFKLHNVMGNNSPQNMVPMFSNASLSDSFKPVDYDVLGETAIWALLKKWGFVVATGFENCGSDFLNYIGRTQNVDNFVNSFYCAVKLYMGVSTDKAELDQRCIGPRMSHNYLLNYTSTFSHLYSSLNQFLYFHIDTAHTQSGQHAALLDSDLQSFLDLYLREVGRDSDLVVFLQGDHGMRYGNWHVDLEAEQEMKLPALFVAMNAGLLDRLPGSYDALWHNTRRLVSKRDLRATILALAGVPFGQKYPVHEEEYLQDAAILYESKAKDSRTCSSLHISSWNCGCMDSPSLIPCNNTRSPVQTLVRKVAEVSLAQVNRLTNTPKHLAAGYICQKLTLKRIIQAYGYRLDNTTEQLRVEYSVKESNHVRFEALAIVGSDTNKTFAYSLPEIEDEQAEYRGFEVGIKVQFTARKDKYAGNCEKLARSLDLRAEFCVCKDLDRLKRDFPGLTEAIL